MLLYTHQLIKYPNKSQLLLYLGHDEKDVNKIWAVKIDDGKPVIDWFMCYLLEYITVPVKNSAIPMGEQIGYGKFKTKSSGVNYIYDKSNPPTEEQLNEFGEYLKGLQYKNEEKEVKQD